MKLQGSAVLIGLTLLASITSWGLADDPPTRLPAIDDEDRQIEILESRRLIEQNCLICHSDEMITHQRLTPKQWTAEVEKMIGWGSPLPRDQAPGVARFLAEAYATANPPPIPEKKPIAPDREFRSISTIAGDPASGSARFAVLCASCHGPTAIGTELGPNLVEKPVLLRDSEFTEVVLKGRRRMPALESVLKPREVIDLLAWLRSRQ